MLEKPVFTYVSVTTKGIKIADILVSHVVADEGFAEPVCSEIENQSASNDAFLKELDNLPAYRFVNHLKFYHPEKALQDVCLFTFPIGPSSLVKFI